MKLLPLLGLVCALVVVAAGYPNHKDMDMDKWRWKKFSGDFASHGFGSGHSDSHGFGDHHSDSHGYGDHHSVSHGYGDHHSDSHGFGDHHSDSHGYGNSHSHEVERKARQSSYGKHAHDWDRDHEVEKEEGAIVLFDKKAPKKEARKSSRRGYLPKSRGSKSSTATKSLVAKASMSYPGDPYDMYYDDMEFGGYGYDHEYDHHRRHGKYSRFGSAYHNLPHEASRRAHRPHMEFDFDYDDYDLDYDYYDPLFGDSHYGDYGYDDFYYPHNRYYNDYDYDFPYEDDYYPYGYGGYEPEPYYDYFDYDFPEYGMDRHYGHFANRHDFGYGFQRMHY